MVQGLALILALGVYVLAALFWLLGVALYSAMFWVLFWFLGIKGGVAVGGAVVSYPVVCGVAVSMLRLAVSVARKE